MRKTARKELPEEAFSEIREEPSAPVSTVENPLMEDLHTVSPSAVPAWKTPSVVVDQKKDPFRSNGMFVSIDQECASSDTDIRPTAPANATIISEEEVKEMFSYSDEQLEYRKDMKFGEKLHVTFRKIAVWFSWLIVTSISSILIRSSMLYHLPETVPLSVPEGGVLSFCHMPLQLTLIEE